MYRTGHYGVSMLLYAPAGLLLALLGSPAFALVGGAGVLALASLPDVDLRLPGVTHRGVTHTLSFALAVGGVFAGAVLALSQSGSTPLPLGEAATSVAFAFAVGTFGILAHLAGDVLTPMGVPLLWPFSSRKYTVSLTRADSTFWNTAFFVLGVFATAVAGYTALRVA